MKLLLSHVFLVRTDSEHSFLQVTRHLRRNWLCNIFTRKLLILFKCCPQLRITPTSTFYNNNIIIKLIILRTKFLVLSPRQKSHRQSSSGLFDKCRTMPSSTDPQTKPINLVSYLKASFIGNRLLSQKNAIGKGCHCKNVRDHVSLS